MTNREGFSINKQGHLEIGGVDSSALVKEFGTPLYVMNEDYIRKVCRSFKDAVDKLYPNSLICYASKAFSTHAIYKIISEEGLGADTVTGGELFTALRAGLNADKIYFHGNNKSEKEINYAIAEGVHALVADCLSELDLIDAAAKKHGKKQQILLRLNPGVEAHTHHYVQTAKPDSKFGFSIADGSAFDAVKYALSLKNIDFLGIHCHIGSQIFETKPFEIAATTMCRFISKIETECGVEVRELNLGGGFGVKYTEEDKPLAPSDYIKAAIKTVLKESAELRLNPPKLIFEPGRSIVAEAGATLYTVGAIKEIKGLKKYVSVDGGMFDNPRYALYQAKYYATLSNRANEVPTESVCIAGKCCESSDILINQIDLPKAKRGDTLCVFSTGAYNYSMASNYNRNAIPPVVMISEGKPRLIIKPQTYEDIAMRDIID